jgi:hypothetical protein
MEKLITSALISFFVVSATYVIIFMTLLTRCSCFVAVFALQFFSIGFLLEIYCHAMSVEYIAGIAARLPVLFPQSWLFPLVSDIDLFRYAPLAICRFFNMRSFSECIIHKRDDPMVSLKTERENRTGSIK